MAGIYLHIPFCTQKCDYCDFFSGNQLYLIDSYVVALGRELELRSEYLTNERISSIYFGGGTPSLLSSSHIKYLLDVIINHFVVEKNAEITIECNPENISDLYIEALNECEVNRISLGVQFLQDDVLISFNRNHSVELIYKALQIIQHSQIKNLSVDLIFGVPGIDKVQVKKYLDDILRFDIKHISAYSLTLNKGSKLYWRALEGSFRESSEEEFVSQYEFIQHKLKVAGFDQYEVSNYARPGYMSKHNMGYWNLVPYLGAGVSAHSYNRVSRRWNKTNIKRYIANSLGGIFDHEIEYLSDNQIYNEYIFLRTRTFQGIDINYLRSTFPGEIYDYFERKKDFLINNHHFQLSNDLLIPLEGDLLLSDYLAKELII